MNASAIYSKSGKGVQEASGKTSHLSRSDRAVLSAIDGRATLADVAQKVGKAFDPAFEKLIETLDKGGFIREVSAGTAAPAAKPGAGARPGGAKSTGPMDVASDLDFTSALSIPKGKAAPPPQAPPKATPPPAKHTATIPPAPPPPSADERAKAERIAREQQEAFVKAREEAERKAQAERDRVKAEAEAKMRAETEARLRAEAEAKAKADAEAKVKAETEAKVKAARDAAARAAAEAKAKAEAEAQRAREEAERARREAAEAAERARAEAEEKARREQEELRRKLEEERRAREEAERKARAEAEEKARREQEELRRKLEEERRAREEAERRAQEEAKRLEEERRKLEEERKARAEEKRREEEERVSRRIQEERERVERKRQQREEEERAARRRAKDEEPSLPKVSVPEPEPEPARAKGGGGAFSDSLLADLESFTTREEQDQKEREEAERKEKEAAAARAREAEERRAREEAERQEREEKERRKREEAERKEKEAAELREREEREKRRLEEEEEKRKQEAEERERKAKQEESLAAKATRSAAFDAEMRAKRERDLMGRSRRAAGARTERRGWGKPIALGLFVLLAAGVGVLHVMPIDTSEFERAATDALGRPVKIGSARLSLVTGLQVRLSDVNLGDGVRIAEVRAYPRFDALTGPRKAFERIEIDRLKVSQEAAAAVFFTRVRAENFSLGRLVAKNLELTGPLALPKGLEAEVSYDGEGVARAAQVRGPEALLAKFTSKGDSAEVEISASSLALPFLPEVALNKFSLKGTASAQGLSVTEWDGALLNGTVSGTANVRWGETWSVDGVVTARNLYAAVFAPTLVSEGRLEGSGKFVMRGDPAKLAQAARFDGSFTVTRGVLGSIDLSRAIQTGGKSATGRTEFSEMSGQAVYDRGAVTLRSITLSAGQLNAGASVDIAQSGALSGRIVADVKVASQSLRATLNLGGTVKEPQVRN
jgi:hypothetical protein